MRLRLENKRKKKGSEVSGEKKRKPETEPAQTSAGLLGFSLAADLQ
jgi:hypothetical protein